jgi:hypothetical protein
VLAELCAAMDVPVQRSADAALARGWSELKA